ncbi:hypothetical protein BUALT_Bualt03G0101300 [Buddleja alternifolia]|uniref:25S rRNA (uridine-N(3))-methyltransferase BMT5-like domain-containing protein n=1 Tax=Buddleja alternifolia TaxID=168488 RepID=A0AAV6XUQ0_9LAMI|nr:hypothetical protein BUALT_Bualt03G0101300 [Buddleja alternifolia]
MGILHSIIRFLGGKTEELDEEEECESGLINPYPVLTRRQNKNNNYYYNSSSNGGEYSSNTTTTITTSFERIRKIVSIHKFIYNASKKLSQKLRIIFQRKPAAAERPILPLKDPAPPPRISSSSNDPLLVQTLLISSPSSTDHLNSYDDHEEFQNDDFVVVPSQQWASRQWAKTEEINNYSDNYVMQQMDDVPSQQWAKTEEINNYSDNYVMQQMDDVIISIPPDFTNPLAHASAREEIIESAVFRAPQINVPNCLNMISTISEKDEDHDEEEEEKVMIKSIITTVEAEDKEEKVINKKSSSVSVVVDEGRWIMHYNSRHRILVVGDGDFSFSASLAVAFRCASNMISTSLDSKEFLKKNYEKFMSNFKQLRSRSCKVMHEIDATKMASHELLGHLTFDRIIYNFPFAGFFKELSRKAQIRRHRKLVNQFLKNAKEMLSENGEIHISHKTNDFHNEWKLEAMASSHRLRLIDAVDFNHLDYPGYNTKCGFGSDNNFNCYPSKTYKFGLKMGRY